ncbi:uracil-DNA glycosylase, family 4 [Bacteroidales bacterium Barb6]|nr:uracil-DNA glycosylase, family 4 [Bacteroidales bacterium Barb6]OAV72352.1 uracil-DNA glycosylase, family 4 [Bacteroidales bacterium Barb6]
MSDTICQNVRNCIKCDLCKNQTPLVQSYNNKEADVFWVGLSAVKTNNSLDIPLSPSTRSGELIHSIESLLPNVSFYKTNVVKCLPLKDDKIRYPSLSEMKNCQFHLESEIRNFKPNVIFLLGKQVSDFVLNSKEKVSLDEGFNYNTYPRNKQIYVPIHHPSFILIYKRKKMTDYLHSIENII